MGILELHVLASQERVQFWPDEAGWSEVVASAYASVFNITLLHLHSPQQRGCVDTRIRQIFVSRRDIVVVARTRLANSVGEHLGLL